MKKMIRESIIFISAGLISMVIFKIINPANYITELILTALVGGFSALVAGYVRDRIKNSKKGN